MSTGIRRRTRRFLTAIAVGGLAAGLCATAVGPSAAATASKIGSAGTTTTGHAALSPSARAAALAALKHLRVGPPTDVRRLPANAAAQISGVTQASPTTVTLVTSTNWSGYTDNNSQGDSYTEVSGNWTQPAVNCSAVANTSAPTFVSFWVGLGGSGDALAQAGTLVECIGSIADYFTFYEIFPNQPNASVIGETVSPGDSIYAQVAGTSGSGYTLSVTDVTNPANGFTVSQNCGNCAGSSADWIVENPNGGSQPLPPFGSWTVNSLTVSGSGNGTGDFLSFPVTWWLMVNSSTGDNLAIPGSTDGTSFTDTWENST